VQEALERKRSDCTSDDAATSAASLEEPSVKSCRFGSSQKTQQAPLLHLRLLVLSGILLPSG